MINTALKILGYTIDWIDLEIISEETLLAQLAQLNKSKEKEPESFRQITFNAYLDRQSQLTDDQLEKILQLTDEGPDRVDLHLQRIMALIYSGVLNNSQFEKLSHYKAVLDNPIQRLYLRIKLIRKIKQFGVSDYFDQVQETKDVALHEFILTRKDLNLKQLKWLKQHGCNKQLREHAQQLFEKISVQ